MLDLQVDNLIRLALAEDIGTGDRTTLATIDAGSVARATLLAKQPLIVAGMPFFERVFALLDPTVVVRPLVAEGTAVADRALIGELRGPARSVLTGERTALNILQRLSGTATETRRCVEAVAGMTTRIADTRKTTPGMRVMQKYAVKVGGGANHRFGLDSGIMIKDNHIAACGSITAAVAKARAEVPHVLGIEVETTNLVEVDEAIAAGADVVLLDNMSTADMAEAVRRCGASPHRIVTEASGNMTLDRLAEVATTGVDVISVGALTHSAAAADISLDFGGRAPA